MINCHFNFFLAANDILIYGSFIHSVGKDSRIRMDWLHVQNGPFSCIAPKIAAAAFQVLY